MSKKKKTKTDWVRVVTEPKSRESCQINSEKGLTALQSPGERDYCLRVGGNVEGQRREDTSLDWVGMGSTGADLDLTILENQ